MTATAIFAVFEGSAVAGSYVVNACSPSSSPGLWAPTNTFPAVFVTGNRCGGPAIGSLDGSHEGALYAEDVLNSSVNIPDGSRAGWTFTAPAGTAITAISYYRTLHAYNDQDMISGIFAADGSPLEQCKIPWPFTHGSNIHCDKVNNQVPVTFSGLNTSGLFMGVNCRIVTGALACIGGGTIHAAAADLYSARVTLSENGAPVLSNVGGPVWSGGVVSGVGSVTFAASDTSGIREQLVRSDTGTTVGLATQPCDFTTAPPCPQQPAGSLNVDTTRVPDGAHTFSLVVTDAAGNTQVATSPSVVVDNNGPPPPAGLIASAKGGGSSVIALAWRNPANPPAPIVAAQVQLCQAVCRAPVSASAGGAAQITAPGPGLYAVRLWLLDARGRGGSHNAAVTTVTVPTAAAGSSATRTRIVAVLKGRRLRVSGTIARSGRVRVSWRSKRRARTLGHGSRVVTIRGHKLTTTFTLTARARSGTTRVAVRSGRHIVAQTRARRG
jgi:hypothetical protein